MSERCVNCGRFFRLEPGVSWAQSWSYDMDGSPDLHDPRFRCRTCTDKHGPLGTNCHYPERYSGVLSAADISAGYFAP
jgi:hypothetical protein